MLWCFSCIYGLQPVLVFPLFLARCDDSCDVVASLRLLHPGPPVEDRMEMDTLRRVAPGAAPRLMWTRFVRLSCRSRRLLVRAVPGSVHRTSEMRCALLLLTCFSGFFLRWSASCSGVKYQSWSDHTYAGLPSWLFASQTDL